jgi:hypothetical protein
VNVDSEKQNVKLIDMVFVGNEVPFTNDVASGGVVMVANNAELEILKSTFQWNDATPIYSRGSVLIHDSYFYGNKGTKVGAERDYMQ